MKTRKKQTKEIVKIELGARERSPATRYEVAGKNQL